MGIGLACGIFIVMVYFVGRGFRNHRRLKRERATQVSVLNVNMIAQIYIACALTEYVINCVLSFFY